MKLHLACILPLLIPAVIATHAAASEPIPVAVKPPAELPAGMTDASDLETESFVTADLNADLQLEYGEFREFISLLADGNHKSAKWVRALRLYSPAFSVMDKNEDGFVDPEELAEGEAEHGK